MKQIEIPRLLHELHGERTSLLSLLLTYFTAVFVSGYVVINAWENQESWRLLLVAFLVFDIAGGVVSNFTQSTRNYYQSQDGLKKKFIALHILHFCLIAVVFSDEALTILLIGITIVLATFLLSLIKETEDVNAFAACIFSIYVVVVFLLFPDTALLKLVLIFLLVKLFLSFSTSSSYFNGKD